MTRNSSAWLKLSNEICLDCKMLPMCERIEDDCVAFSYLMDKPQLEEIKKWKAGG